MVKNNLIFILIFNTSILLPQISLANYYLKITLKITELGGKVVTLSGPDGYVHDPAGVNTDEKIAYLLEMRASGNDKVQDYADKFGVEFFAGEKPWGVKADIVIPCATQNEIHLDDAKKIVANGVQIVCEGSNMPTTNEALQYLQENNVLVGPAKAANAGFAVGKIICHHVLICPHPSIRADSINDLGILI